MSVKTIIISLSIVLFWGSSSISSQGHWGDYISTKEANSTYHVFGEKVNLREKPDTKSKVISVLNPGDPILILEQSKQKLEQNNLAEYWYKIKFKNFTGYLWGGLISDYSFSDSKFTVLCKNLGVKLTGLELRLVEKNKIISSLRIKDGPVSNEAWGFTKYKESDFSPSPISLIGLKYFVFSEIEYGYSQETIITISKDKKLTSHFSWLAGSCDPPSCMESWLVFPSDTLKKDSNINRKETKGKTNKILEVSRSYDIDDPNSNDYFEKTHTWNGKTFISKETN